MTRNQLWMRLGGVAVLCLLCAYSLWPISRSLKLGLDLNGGYSLLYEIDTTGLPEAEQAHLANNVIDILKRRVDPNNVRNLVWRAVGNNRIEIQMPRASSEVSVRREQFDALYNRLAKTNLTVADLYAALSKTGNARQDAFDEMARYDPRRASLFPVLVQAYNAHVQPGSATQPEAAATQPQADLDRAIDDLLATNFPIQRLMNALEAGPPRSDQAVSDLSAEYPARRDLIVQLAGAYQSWSQVKSGLDDPADLERLLSGAGVLEFRILAEPGDPDVDEYIRQLQERGPRIHKGDVYGWFQAKPEEFSRPSGAIVQKYGDKLYVLADLSPDKGLLAGGERPWKLVRASPSYDLQRAGFAVDFQLDEYGGQLFGDLTANNLRRRLCILLDNVAISAPVIQSRIGTNGQITGNFSQEQARELAQVLNAGALPARLKQPPLSVRSVGPTLGATNRAMGLRASYLGLIAVVVFMAIYYLFGGIIADLAVAINLLITLGVMAAFKATFTLPGVAGLILSVGMAVDSNVLIFERFREEQARGVGLRLAIKYGYERAWRTILDSHVTTLISCAILYYFGSEDIRGFALVLGLGLLANLFTAVFMTRWIFELLLSYGAIQRLRMLHLIRHANVDWWGLRRFFIPISVLLVLASLIAYFSRDPQTLYGIEFLGGTSAQIELKQAGSMTDEQVREQVTNASISGSAVSWLESAAGLLDQAARTGVTSLGAGTFQVQIPPGARPDLRARQIQSFLEALNSPAVEKNGIRGSGIRSVTVTTPALADVKLNAIQALVADAANYLRRAADKMSAAQVQTVRETENPADRNRLFEIVTTETNEYIVREAVVATLGDRLKVERAIAFVPRTNPRDNNVPYFPIVRKYLGEDIHDNSIPLTDVREYLGGVAIVMDDLKPAITTASFDRRLREMRLQPDFEHYAWRQFQVIGLKQSGVDEESKEPTYSSMAVVVNDPNVPYDEGRAEWESQLARPELQLTEASLNTERTLRQVVQFAPQVAAQTEQRAILAMVLALFGISAYIWIRFGTVRHGMGAVLSLFHDVSIAMGAIAISAFLAYTAVGRVLLIGDYKMDLTLMAALLTLVGYSLNDTIVVFDRIRENRGRMHEMTPAVMNAAVNQTLSRTILTSLTVFIVVLIMYVVGGPGIQGFAYVMVVGTLVGTYSSFAVASPLLLLFSRNQPGDSQAAGPKNGTSRSA